MKSIFYFTLFICTFIMTACNSSSPTVNSQISGQITLRNTSFNATLSQKKIAKDVSEKNVSFQSNLSTTIPGEIIVKFEDTLSAQTSSLFINSTRLEQLRSLALSNTKLFQTPNLTAAETTALARSLSLREDVAYAIPNKRYYPLITEPNDAFYSYQWHYPAINLPQAWDITTGSSETVVAVIDTGYIGHPEFSGKPLLGYDFVTDISSAGDGDGIDPNPTDLGSEQETGYHGTHVAGTIAARTNDGSGIAGVNWAATLLHVRALGRNGGSLSDIMDSVLWAAGLHPSIPNSNPADVFNLSLGGTGPCDSFEQDVFQQVINQGGVVIVAAGNENQDAGFVSPANCPNVITVGATDFSGGRAPYSNYGAKIDVMAPGGNVNIDLNQDSYIDGVLSLGFDENRQEYSFPFYQGTSMATPHVAGVVSLMKAVDPNITQSEVLQALQNTARPLNASQCRNQNTDVSTSDCGAGLIDANAALLAIDKTNPPNDNSFACLSFSPNIIDFGLTTNQLTVQLSNNHDDAIDWTIDTFYYYDKNPGDVSDNIVDLSIYQGNLEGQSSQEITLFIDRNEATANGVYQLDLAFEAGSTEYLLPIFFTKGESSNTPAGDLEKTQIIFLDITSTDNQFGNSSFAQVSGSGESVSYASNGLANGDYWVTAWKDVDQNGEIDTGDFFGFYSIDSLGATEIRPPASNIDFPVEEITDETFSLKRQSSLDSLREWLQFNKSKALQDYGK